jgi:hypothetical protein
MSLPLATLLALPTASFPQGKEVDLRFLEGFRVERAKYYGSRRQSGEIIQFVLIDDRKRDLSTIEGVFKRAWPAAKIYRLGAGTILRIQERGRSSRFSASIGYSLEKLSSNGDITFSRKKTGPIRCLLTLRSPAD